MVTVGIDQSYTSCGFVALDGKKILHAEVYASDKESDIFWRSWTQMLYTVDLVRKHHPAHIAIEGLAFMRFGNATRDLAGLQFVIVTQLRYNQNRDVEIVPPLTLKKFATGGGKATKDDMVAALPEDVRQYFTDKGFKKTKGLYDITDAYWLARYSQEKHNPSDAKALKKKSSKKLKSEPKYQVYESVLEPKHFTVEQIREAVKTVAAETNSEEK